MKKLLSTLLAVVMVFATFAMLIPTATAAANEPTVLYEQNFDDAALASKTGDELAQALWGANVEDDPATEDVNEAKLNYKIGEAARLAIVDGKLEVDADADVNFEALLVEDERIKEQGVVVEAEYMFREGEKTSGRFLMFTPKDVVGRNDINTLLVAPYNNATSRTAWRNNTSGGWAPLMFGPNVEASGTTGAKYKMKGVFSPEEGPKLYVAAWNAQTNAYGDYVDIGHFEGDNLTAYQQSMKDVADMFCGTMIMRLQNCNMVTLDNVKVTLLEKQTYNVKINGVDTTIEAAGEYDLTPHLPEVGEFCFAMVDGVKVESTTVTITENTNEIDIYTLSVDTMDGAALTTGDTTSVRWQAGIAKAEYDALVALKDAGKIKNIEVGVMYIEAKSLGRGEEPTLETEGIQKVAATLATSAYTDMVLFNGDTAAITADNYNTAYAGRSYLVVTFADDTTITLVGDYNNGFHARSAAGLAVAAVADVDNGLSDAQAEKVEAIAAAYVK